jgi:hypothetical protein
MQYRPVKLGPRGRPETSGRNYRYSLRNNIEERISHLLRGGSLKSRIPNTSLFYGGCDISLNIQILDDSDISFCKTVT